MTPIDKFNMWNRKVFTLGKHNNNPFNIRWSNANKWEGQSHSYKGFVYFHSIEYGIRAAICLIRNYLRINVNTPRKIIERFAPPSENDTQAYLFYISGSALDLDKEIKFGSIEFYTLLQLMCKYESDCKITSEVINYIINQFKIMK